MNYHKMRLNLIQILFRSMNTREVVDDEPEEIR